jgi:hypothetical protein
MSLLTLIRRHGIRRGFSLWRIGQAVKLDQAVAVREHPFRPFHGERPRMTGYRRRPR